MRRRVGRRSEVEVARAPGGLVAVHCLSCGVHEQLTVPAAQAFFRTHPNSCRTAVVDLASAAPARSWAPVP